MKVESKLTIVTENQFYWLYKVVELFEGHSVTLTHNRQRLTVSSYGNTISRLFMDLPDLDRQLAPYMVKIGEDVLEQPIDLCKDIFVGQLLFIKQDLDTVTGVYAHKGEAVKVLSINVDGGTFTVQTIPGVKRTLTLTVDDIYLTVESYTQLKDFGYAIGNYIISCSRCSKQVSYCDKRSVICKECALELYKELSK